MPMMSFFESFECKSESHCDACRRYVTGAGFRVSIAKDFITQEAEDGGNECNYACPTSRGGKPWIMEGESQVVSLSVSAATRKPPRPTLTPEEREARKAEAERRAAEDARKPGTVLAAAIQAAVGVDLYKGAGCGVCAERRDLMNRWGYTGCVVRWRTIYGWLAERAAENDISITPALVLRAILGAAKQAAKGDANQ